MGFGEWIQAEYSTCALPLKTKKSPAVPCWGLLVCSFVGSAPEGARVLPNVCHNALVCCVHIHIHNSDQFIAAYHTGHNIQFCFWHAENLGQKFQQCSVC